jgi:hypothetical protein
LSRVGLNQNQPAYKTIFNLGEIIMIEIDYGPACLGGIILLVFTAPMIYGLFLDRIKA